MKSFKFLFTVCFFISLTYVKPSLAYSFSNLSDTILLADSTIKADSLIADSVIDLKNQSALKSKVTYSAIDSIRYDITGKMVYLYNGGIVSYEDIELKADYIVINQETLTIYAEGVADSSGTIKGKPDFKQGEESFKADKVAYNFKTKKGKIENAVTSQGNEGYLRGSQIKKNEKDEIFTKNGIYTTCELDHPHFGIVIARSKTTKKRIISGPAFLQIEDVPLPLAIPFGFFPKRNTRASGILMPTIGEDRALGFFFQNGGYYLGISDNLDLSLKGSIFTKGSYRLNAETRYLTRYKYSGNVNIGYSERKIGEPETSSFELTKDYFIRWNHTQDAALNPGVTFSANVNLQSNTNLRNNSYNVTDQVTNSVFSSINFNKVWTGTPFNFNSSLRHDQNVRTGVVNLDLPTFSFSMASIRPFDSKNRTGQQTWWQKINVSYQLSGSNKVTTGDSILLQRETLDNFTTGFTHRIPIGTSIQILKHFTLSPSFNYNEYLYFQSSYKYFNGDRIITDTAEGVLNGRDYSFGTSLQTIIFGQANVNKFGIKAIRHVLTPSFGFSYRPDFGEERFGYYESIRRDQSTINPTRYSKFEAGAFGGPQQGRSQSLSISLENNLEMKVRNKNDTITGTSKIKLLESLNFNAGYNFAADSFQLSTIQVSGRTTLFNKVGINFGANYDPYAREERLVGTIPTKFRVQKFELTENKRLARLTTANLNLSTSLNGSGKTRTSAITDPARLNSINNSQPSYVDFSIPWNLSLGYFLQYTADSEDKFSQTVNISGDINLTKKWKLSATSGYDLKTNQITPTNLNINRDLHCWDLAIRWTPFGVYQSYGVTLRVKAQILQDLKLTRQKEFYQD